MPKDPVNQPHLFIVRVWHEPGTVGASLGRGSVEHVSSGQRLYFSALRDLNDFIILRSGARFYSSENGEPQGDSATQPG